MPTKMGYEKRIYYGVAGSQAATQLTYVRDVTYTRGTTNGETTSGGDGSAPPIETFRVAARTAELRWDMVNNSSDTALASLLAAQETGTPVAIYYKDYATGRGFDGDVILTVENGAPYKGEQTYSFTAVPNDDSRTPDLQAA